MITMIIYLYNHTNDNINDNNDNDDDNDCAVQRRRVSCHVAACSSGLLSSCSLKGRVCQEPGFLRRSPNRFMWNVT